jgi:histidinol phosphatase-like PHP family hydrolase
VPEINTQGLRKPAQILVPGADILRWYVEMGGVSICLGSDAHIASHVGLNLDDAISTACQAGLKYITYFDQRQRRLAPLPKIE